MKVLKGFMNDNKFPFTQVIYADHLTTIAGKNISKREVDVLACILSGRPAKGIGRFLSISDRTVESHTYNIMAALECPSRENLISFIERSDKFLILREYYVKLLAEVTFEGFLKKIPHLTNNTIKKCLITHSKEEESVDSFIKQLKKHLNFAGIETSIESRDQIDWTDLSPPKTKATDYKLYVVSRAADNKDNFSHSKIVIRDEDKGPFSHTLFLFLENSEMGEFSKELSGVGCIDFTKPENYYFSVFELLQKLFPDVNFDDLIKEFKAQYNSTNGIPPQVLLSKVAKPENKDLSHAFKENFLTKGKWYVLGAFIIIVTILSISGVIFFTGKGDQPIPSSASRLIGSSIRSDLPIPSNVTLLNRSELIAQLNEKFKDQEGIQTVALVGIGGSGKTTLARQYGHGQKANVVWEINAETSGSLYGSFEKLAYALSKTEKDQNLLRGLLEIKNVTEKKEKLVHFVKERLKSQSPWFLVFDNVEHFSDVQSYFPLDAKTWGAGKVILTTRNRNIQNNQLVSHVISIGELPPNQKQELFAKIMHDEALQASEKREIATFLTHIPPFPLDVSVAAYYLKATNISYDQYLEKIENQTKETNELHENILKETGEYTKTRYAIITQSLEHLIKNNKGFADLLLFISLLDSQNIPKGLLDQYKESNIVDKFIYHLKKYSLLTAQTLPSPSEPMYSMHRSTQTISLVYLTELLKLNKDSPLLKEIAYALDDYADKIVEQEDFPRMQIMARHIEKLLEHSLLTDFSKGLLESKLGSIYYFINNEKSKKTIDDSLNLLKTKDLENLLSEEILKLACSLLHIGAVYTELRLDKEAQETLEKAVDIYRTYTSKNNADLSWGLSHLGNVHRKLGNYENAKNYFEESIRLHKEYGFNNKRIARTLSYLGATYRGLGLYQRSIDTLEESLALYKKFYSNEHYRIGWILVQLGNVFSKLGDFQKAKKYLENGLFIFQKCLPEHHVSIGIALTYLGNCYRELGENEKSLTVLEKSSKIHEKHFGKNHPTTGWVSYQLANTYKAMGKAHYPSLF